MISEEAEETGQGSLTLLTTELRPGQEATCYYRPSAQESNDLALLR